MASKGLPSRALVVPRKHYPLRDGAVAYNEHVRPRDKAGGGRMIGDRNNRRIMRRNFINTDLHFNSPHYIQCQYPYALLGTDHVSHHGGTCILCRLCGRCKDSCRYGYRRTPGSTSGSRRCKFGCQFQDIRRREFSTCASTTKRIQTVDGDVANVLQTVPGSHATSVVFEARIVCVAVDAQHTFAVVCLREASFKQHHPIRPVVGYGHICLESGATSAAVQWLSRNEKCHRYSRNVDTS